MATDIVLASELGPEFDVGVDVANTITIPKLLLIEAYLQDRHVIETPGIVINNNQNVFTDVINGNIGPVDGGTYQVVVSYLWNLDNGVGDDFESFFTVNGAELVTAGAQGFLHKQEPKDHAGAAAEYVTGTTSTQRMAFTKVFENVVLPAGLIPILLQARTEDTGFPVAIWNAVVTVQRTSYP